MDQRRVMRPTGKGYDTGTRETCSVRAAAVAQTCGNLLGYRLGLVSHQTTMSNVFVARRRFGPASVSVALAVAWSVE